MRNKREEAWQEKRGGKKEESEEIKVLRVNGGEGRETTDGEDGELGGKCLLCYRVSKVLHHGLFVAWLYSS